MHLSSWPDKNTNIKLKHPALLLKQSLPSLKLKKKIILGKENSITNFGYTTNRTLLSKIRSMVSYLGLNEVFYLSKLNVCETSQLISFKEYSVVFIQEAGNQISVLYLHLWLQASKPAVSDQTSNCFRDKHSSFTQKHMTDWARRVFLMMLEKQPYVHRLMFFKLMTAKPETSINSHNVDLSLWNLFNQVWDGRVKEPDRWTGATPGPLVFWSVFPPPQLLLDQFQEIKKLHLPLSSTVEGERQQLCSDMDDKAIRRKNSNRRNKSEILSLKAESRKKHFTSYVMKAAPHVLLLNFGGNSTIHQETWPSYTSTRPHRSPVVDGCGRPGPLNISAWITSNLPEPRGPPQAPPGPRA